MNDLNQVESNIIAWLKLAKKKMKKDNIWQLTEKNYLPNKKFWKTFLDDYDKGKYIFREAMKICFSVGNVSIYFSHNC